MWDWELIKSGSSQGRYEVLVQYTHEDFHYAHAISYDTEQNEYCLHNHALYELVYCVRGDVIYQAEGVRYQMEPHSLLLLAPAVLHKGTSKNPLKIRSKCSAGIEIATFATTLSKHR